MAGAKTLTDHQTFVTLIQSHPFIHKTRAKIYKITICIQIYFCNKNTEMYQIPSTKVLYLFISCD